MEHAFTSTIKLILEKHFTADANDIFDKSLLLQYINKKTRSAERGSKSRSSFGSLYAIYTILEDYIANDFQKKGNYSDYEGASFAKLLARARQLPFGAKQQNHSFNNRANSEFQKYFPTTEYTPIIRNLETSKYWINENLLRISVGKKKYNISSVVIEIIDEYIRTKESAFNRFIAALEKLRQASNAEQESSQHFILEQLAPNVDARLFEIVSYSILKFFYQEKIIIWGFDMESLKTENLKLYKTGRTNANDGGIDFVMKPLGRFFQVTETLDFKKYFLDIDKVQKYPITFVVKSEDTISNLKDKIRLNAMKVYPVAEIVNSFMDCVEEVINISVLKERFADAIKQGYTTNILDEIILQSKVEFNYSE